MRYADTVLDLIGNTPLVRLNSVASGVRCTVLAKLEFLNPGGSVKDRIALRMIQRAEQEGELAPGGTIVEPTSGNTGVGLALVGALRGYSTVFVTPDKVGEEKRAVLRAYGADVVVTSSTVPPDSPDSYYGVSDAIVARTSGAYKPDQFSNPGAPESHYATTGPEIWEDTDGTVTHVVMSAGTGGTITGTGRYLKEVSAGRRTGPVRIIGADPAGSVYSGGQGRPYFTEGVGEDMWPGNYDPSVPDRVEPVDDAEAFAMTRRLAREEGLLVGGSSGMAVVAALRVAAELDEDAVMVVLLPDSGRGYLGKIFDDTWMRAHGFDVAAPGDGELRGRAPGEATARGDAAASGTPPGTVGAALSAGARPARTGLAADTEVDAALAALAEAGLAALPVHSGAVPAREGEVRGSVSVARLHEALASGTARGTTSLSRLLEPALPTVGIGEPLSALIGAWANAPAAAVLRGGEIVDVVATTDLTLG